MSSQPPLQLPPTPKSPPSLLTIVLIVAIVGLAALTIGSVVFNAFQSPGSKMLEDDGDILKIALPTLTALFAFLRSHQNARKLDTLSISIDGRLQQLLDVTSASQLAKGVLQGKADHTEALTEDAGS